MKIKKFMAMMIAAVTLCAGFTSCGDDDDDNTVPAAESLAGTYTGTLTISVMGSESTDTVSYVITKEDDTHVKMTIPAAGSGAMALPSITVDNIPVTTSTVAGVEIVSASLESASGTITVNDAEKSYTFSDIVIVGQNKTAAINYSLQYGKMPMAMVCAFTGNK